MFLVNVSMFYCVVCCYFKVLQCFYVFYILFESTFLMGGIGEGVNEKGRRSNNGNAVVRYKRRLLNTFNYCNRGFCTGFFCLNSQLPVSSAGSIKD